MGWIDNEIDNYYVLKNRWEMNQSSENGQYCFNIEKVDRTDIGYDKDQFVPDNDMKFVLNQSKILELLMVIQLYKDPFLCLREIFQNALDFSNVRLRDCIVPRTEIVACDKTAALEDLRSRFVETGLSKILVYNENIDDIVGYIHSSEMFKNPEDWTQSIRSVSIVPETMAANKLMKVLMQDKKSMAVVVDEFGGTSGIVTLEDLVEEIFGEIEDEHDIKSYVAKKVGDDEYLLSGRIEIDTLNEKFDLELPESDDYVTIAGFILHFYQKFPKLNETIVIDKYSFKIVKVTATKIELVRMKVVS